jgi:hypothetical protein
MIAKRSLLWLFLGAALTGMTCAPQGELPQKKLASFTPVPSKVGDVVDPLPLAPTNLKDRLDAALDNVSRRDLLTTHAFWTVFHGILGLGPDVTLLDPDTDKRVKALDFICSGGSVRGLEFTPMANGVDVVTMAGSGVGQGHQDQFIAEMAQWGMPMDRKFVVKGKEYTYGDFLRHARDRVQVTGNQELSWAILIIGQYFGTDLQWTNTAGEKLKFEDVVRYELDQAIDTAACGGTHRLFGLTWAYHQHRARGGQKVGVWKDVADRIDQYKKLAHKFQNPDGAFSSNYVSKPGSSEDSQVRIATTGHVLEWLALAMTDRELTEPWVQDAANSLALMILRHRSDPIDGGALYHAVHGLLIYRTRVFHTPTPHLLVPPPPKDG